jgi:uncharacterized tellurite resistance protein B-like protein
MFEYLRKIISPENDLTGLVTSNHKTERDKKIEIAACALFIEMAQVDGEFTDDERKFILSEMKKTFDLDEECANNLMDLAEKKVKESVSVYEFTTIINTTFSNDEKLDLIQRLWKLIYRDNKLSAYEDQLIKRIAGNLNIEHKDIINAKLLVKEQMGLK